MAQDPLFRIEADGRHTEVVLREDLLKTGQKDPYPKLEGIPAGDSEISVNLEVKGLLARHGREAYLRKRTGQRCHCLDPQTGEADVDCPTCSGLGYVYLDHVVRIFKVISTRQVSGAYRKEIAPFGVIAIDETVYYVETPSIRPSIHDWVVEVITDAKGKIVRPPLIERAVDVNDVVDLRENYGQLAFWALLCRKVGIGK